MADIGWRRRRGSSPAARTGARQRAGLTPASASNTLSCQRETLHSRQLRSIKKSIDSDHGIYRGGALVIPDMLGGRIHVYWPTPATVLPLIREGRIKALAISSQERNPDLSDVPTMNELGLPELSLEFWAGMWAPAGTPADVVDKLNAAINAALQSPEMIASMKKLGFELRIGSARDFAAFVAAEIPHWTAVVKASGVKSQ